MRQPEAATVSALISVTHTNYLPRLCTHISHFFLCREHNLFKNSSSLWKCMMHPDRQHRFKQPAHNASGTNAATIPLKHIPLLTSDHNAFRVMIVRQVTVWNNYWMRYTAVPCTTRRYVSLLDQATAVTKSAPVTSPDLIRSDSCRSETDPESIEEKASEH